MKAFRTKPIHPKVTLHYHNFSVFKKIKNFDFEGYFHLLEKGKEAIHYFRRKLPRRYVIDKFLNTPVITSKFDVIFLRSRIAKQVSRAFH